MDSFEFNKIAGAVLGTLLITLGLGIVAEEIFHGEAPEKQGYAIAVAEDEGQAGEAGAETAAVAIATLLQAADPAKGQAAAKPCTACHTFEKGGQNKVGPNLWDIVNRNIAVHEGFAYSDALKAKSGEQWTFDELDAFIRDPRSYAPGTKMTYAGLKRDNSRADLLAYLRTLSDNPAPLPPAAAASQAEQGQEQGQGLPQEVTPQPGEGAAAAPAPAAPEPAPAATPQ
jgi:cytochrome c